MKKVIPIILLSLWALFCIIGAITNMSHYDAADWVVIALIAIIPFAIFFIVKISRKKSPINNDVSLKPASSDLGNQSQEYTNVPVPTVPIFTVTQCVSPPIGANYFEIDEKNKLWRAPNSSQSIFKCSDLLDYEVVQNGSTVTKGGLGRAIVGGALFGGVGAIVGGATGKKKSRERINEFKVKIITSVPSEPLVYICFNTMGVYSDSPAFSAYTLSADKITAILSRIISENKSAAANPQQPARSSADEIMEYKQLLDSGAITQEEFEAKKKQLLNL